MANGFVGREGKGHSHDRTASKANIANTANIARRGRRAAHEQGLHCRAKSPAQKLICLS